MPVHYLEVRSGYRLYAGTLACKAALYACVGLRTLFTWLKSRMTDGNTSTDISTTNVSADVLRVEVTDLKIIIFVCNQNVKIMTNICFVFRIVLHFYEIIC
jgi:hypothetical protein